jgi:O-methyltransferase
MADPFKLDPEDEPFADIWTSCEPYTMTSFERGLALFRSIRYLHQNSFPGDIVECGVWRGGSTMIAMHALRLFGMHDRRVWLFDTFEGMTEPAAVDVDCHGRSAEQLLEQTAERKTSDYMWALAPLDEVKRNIAQVGYDPGLVEFVVGDVRKTLAGSSVNDIALLRLDTDFYDSTKTELELLYPRLRERGVLIIDDFGHWQGARRAVDEYFDLEARLGRGRPYLHYIDYTGRLAIKASAATRIL